MDLRYLQFNRHSSLLLFLWGCCRTSFSVHIIFVVLSECFHALLQYPNCYPSSNGPLCCLLCPWTSFGFVVLWCCPNHVVSCLCVPSCASSAAFSIVPMSFSGAFSFERNKHNCMFWFCTSLWIKRCALVIAACETINQTRSKNLAKNPELHFHFHCNRFIKSPSSSG